MSVSNETPGAAVRPERAVAGTPEQPQTRVRAALARFGGGHRVDLLRARPLFRSVRAVHPKADLKIIERAYEVAKDKHEGQLRRSGEPYITHPLAVTQILADLGMTPPTLCAGAAARHRRGHRLLPRPAAGRLR